MQKKELAIVDYGMGNITSLQNAIQYLGYEARLVGEAEDLAAYPRLVLPGVGAFPDAMQRLREKGLDVALRESVKSGKTLVGICLGMQLLFSQSSEFGKTTGLNIIPGSVCPFKAKTDLQVPHMGWNDVTTKDETFKAFTGDYYFVHSFYAVPAASEDILFEAQYGISFCAGVRRGANIFGFQFHPEKSQQLGLNLLKQVLC